MEMDLVIGKRVGEPDVPNIGVGQVFVLDKGSGEGRVVAKVSIVRCLSDKKYEVTILSLDPRTGNYAPPNIRIGATISAYFTHLHFTE
jgi:hypothetical protein